MSDICLQVLVFILKLLSFKAASLFLKKSFSFYESVFSTLNTEDKMKSERGIPTAEWDTWASEIREDNIIDRETEPYGQHLCRHTPCLSGTPRSIQQPCYTTALKELNNAEEPLLKHWPSHSFTFSYNFNTVVWNWAIWGGKKDDDRHLQCFENKKNTHNVFNRKKKLLKKGEISCFLRRLLADT